MLHGVGFVHLSLLILKKPFYGEESSSTCCGFAWLQLWECWCCWVVVVLSQVGADLYHPGVLMEEEHHQLLCSLMSGAHCSIALVLSWLLTCVTAH